MPNKKSIDGYARTLLSRGLFLYVSHPVKANYLQFGVGFESNDGLQLAHVPGPQIHELHVSHFLAWLKREGTSITLDGETSITNHPFSSKFTVDLPVRLSRLDYMQLSAGRYSERVGDNRVTRGQMLDFMQRVSAVRNEVFGHPTDWDVREIPLDDGRFLWVTYDSAIDKVRTGIGFYDEGNTPVYGDPCYAIAPKEYQAWCAYQYLYVDAPLSFYATPPGWPLFFETIITGLSKQVYVCELLRLCDEVWS